MAERTPESLIFGVEARWVTSASPRFVWSLEQESAFWDHLKIRYRVRDDNKYDDLEQLLVALDLHGYGNIRNVEGQSVRTIISTKVKAKIRKMLASVLPTRREQVEQAQQEPQQEQQPQEQQPKQEEQE
ncbi:hypothetical protein F4825DRAFT_223282 [Nemania diffusa]|nr:hypothetical protein F4825DRAFT_223282 [Nemania diffusa]